LKAEQKHFLDTSVARPMLLGTKAYRRYFSQQFGEDPCYVVPYVQMEFRRSYLRNLINFYFVLDLPTIPTYGDALTFWSNRFKTSEQKAVMQLAGQLANAHRIDQTRARDKPAALRALADYIKRVDVKLRRAFSNPGKDSARCARAAVPLQVTSDAPSEGLRHFLEAFDDVKTCRSKCRIDDFLLRRYRDSVNGYVTASKTLPPHKDNDGFLGVAGNLEDVLKKGATACTCARCEKIGDAVIALDAPRDMRLEHTDHSFDHLCRSIKQPHYKHPSEAAVVTGGAAPPGGGGPAGPSTAAGS
jgi:hypothetical protein